jgi:hypothetical protein
MQVSKQIASSQSIPGNAIGFSGIASMAGWLSRRLKAYSGGGTILPQPGRAGMNNAETARLE